MVLFPVQQAEEIVFTLEFYQLAHSAHFQLFGYHCFVIAFIIGQRSIYGFEVLSRRILKNSLCLYFNELALVSHSKYEICHKIEVLEIITHQLNILLLVL